MEESIMNEEKNMQFANFNITYGENEVPMLTYFEELIYPVFTSGYVRKNRKTEYPQFSFSDIEIKELLGEYVLVGNYIKNTQYSVNTKMDNGKLVDSPSEIPTAPYSRFIIFLNNHRMVLVKNEPYSPDVRSFEATMRDFLKRYIKEKNDAIEDPKGKFPMAHVNIVDMPLTEDIDKILRGTKKIQWIKLRFFPLNNDINPIPIADAIDREKVALGSNTANVIFNSPKSTTGVKNILEETSGLVATSMRIEEIDGEKRTIKEGSLTSSKRVKIYGNISKNDDGNIAELAKKNEMVSKVSEDNRSLYEKVKEKLAKLML